MLDQVQPIQSVFLGLLAGLIAWSLARGINALRDGQGFLLIHGLFLMLFVGIMLFIGFGEASLTPPQTSISTWLVAGIIFLAVFVVNLIALPFLKRRYSPRLVQFLSYAAALFLVSAFLAWMVDRTAPARTARMGEMFLPLVLFGIGVLVSALGLWKWSRGEI